MLYEILKIKIDCNETEDKINHVNFEMRQIENYVNIL